MDSVAKTNTTLETKVETLSDDKAKIERQVPSSPFLSPYFMLHFARFVFYLFL